MTDTIQSNPRANPSAVEARKGEMARIAEEADAKEAEALASAEAVGDTTAECRQVRVMTLDEVAAVLGISRNSAYEAAKRKEIPTIRIGRRWLVPRDALNRLLSGSDDSGRAHRVTQAEDAEQLWLPLPLPMQTKATRQNRALPNAGA
jgi:excisionase family DNA binding protein